MDGSTLKRSLRAAEMGDLAEHRSMRLQGSQEYARNGRWVNYRMDRSPACHRSCMSASLPELTPSGHTQRHLPSPSGHDVEMETEPVSEGRSSFGNLISPRSLHASQAPLWIHLASVAIVAGRPFWQRP